MNVIIWIIPALLIACILIFMASRQTRRLLPAIELAEGESLPATRVQTYARWTLLGIGFLTAFAFSMVMYHGALVWWENDIVRRTFTFVLLGALLIYLWFNLTLKSLESRGDGSFDERDSIIVGRSCAGVGAAMMTVTAAWMIGLTEAYRGTHLVPTYYLYLLFWSCVMTNVIASTAGILLAYRKS